MCLVLDVQHQGQAQGWRQACLKGTPHPSKKHSEAKQAARNSSSSSACTADPAAALIHD